MKTKISRKLKNSRKSRKNHVSRLVCLGIYQVVTQQKGVIFLMKISHDVTFRLQYKRSYFVLVLYMKWTSDCGWIKWKNRAKMSKVDAIIFFQRFILETKFRHKKYSARRVLSEYVSNSKLEQQKVDGPIWLLMRPRPYRFMITRCETFVRLNSYLDSGSKCVVDCSI